MFFYFTFHIKYYLDESSWRKANVGIKSGSKDLVIKKSSKKRKERKGRGRRRG
jgi:hypothetical protein